LVNAAVLLPEWVPADSWAAFVAMRIKTKQALTEEAIPLALKALAKLRSEGQDVRAVLDQSTFNNWRGLFEVKGGQQGRSGAAPAKFDPVASVNRNRNAP
jgi:hypothetical protein